MWRRLSISKVSPKSQSHSWTPGEQLQNSTQKQTLISEINFDVWKWKTKSCFLGAERTSLNFSRLERHIATWELFPVLHLWAPCCPSLSPLDTLPFPMLLHLCLLHPPSWPLLSPSFLSVILISLPSPATSLYIELMHRYPFTFVELLNFFKGVTSLLI